MDFDSFVLLPNEEIARAATEHGPLVCAFPINGTRRWFLLEHAAKLKGNPTEAYLNITQTRHIELYRMIFEHGIHTLLSPVFGPDLLERGSEYVLQVGIEGISRLATHPEFLTFYDECQVRVRFYGDYQRKLDHTPYEFLISQIEAVQRRTKDYQKSKLFYGIFGNDPSEQIAAIALEFYQQQGRLPDRQEIIQQYYGDIMSSVSFFIGFDKFSAFDMPLIATGEEDLYFTASPSPYLTERELRVILYDHLFTRRAAEPDYPLMPASEIDWMRRFYSVNLSQVLGIGKLHGGIWYPISEIQWPEQEA